MKLKPITQNKKGSSSNSKIEMMIGVVVLLILVAVLAPQALSGLFDSDGRFSCVTFNDTEGFEGECLVSSGVPGWIAPTLGALGAVAFIYIIWRSVKK